MIVTNKSHGFSLIEVAIGLLIIGIIIAPMMDAWAVYKKQQEYSLTTGNLATIKTALQKYVLNTGTYPAPGGPGLASANANFGQETALALAAIPACAPDLTTVCKTVGYRAAVGPGNDPVLVGDLPFATLGLPKNYAVDGFNRKFTYAVSAYLTDKYAGAFGDGNGVIRVIDSTGADTQNTTTASAPAGPFVHYVVVSHGKDGVGAFTREGVEVARCTGAIGKDVENCNNDGQFDSNSGNYNDVNGAQYGRLESTAAGPNHFDDYLTWTTSTTGDIWIKQSGVAANIVNNNSGNVRVGGGGVVAPQAKIDVRGTLTADALQTNDICDTSGNSYAAPNYTNVACEAGGPTAGLVNAWPKNVFSPAIIAGTPNANDANKPGGGILCSVVGGTGLAMSGIADSDEECNNAVTAGQNIGTCAGGTAPSGINAAGHVVCTAP